MARIEGRERVALDMGELYGMMAGGSPGGDKPAMAITGQEGFFAPAGSVGPNRPQRNHNPWDLRGWPGYPQDDGGFSVFPSDEVGWEKLYIDLRTHAARYPNQTLLEFVSGDGNGWPCYAPACDGNEPQRYARRWGTRD